MDKKKQIAFTSSLSQEEFDELAKLLYEPNEKCEWGFDVLRDLLDNLNCDHQIELNYSDEAYKKLH